MRTKSILVLLCLALLVPAVARGHEGHAHKYMGTVISAQGNHLELKTTDGKTIKVVLNAKTAFARGKQKVDGASVKVGERVVVAVPSEKDMIASTVTMAAARTVAAK